MNKPISKSVKNAVEDALRTDFVASGDKSYCMPSWIQTFSDAFIMDEDVHLSANAAAALYHTLLVSESRVARLVGERDKYLEQLKATAD